MDMRALIRENPGMAEKLVVALICRLREANERISRQSFQTVPSRVAGAQQAARRGGDDAAGQGRRDDPAAAVGPRADGGYLAESVSRFLATLERAGVVQVGRGRVTVIEPERLDAYIF